MMSADQSVTSKAEADTAALKDPAQQPPTEPAGKGGSSVETEQKLVPKLHLKLPKVNVVLTRCDKEKPSPSKTIS
jgi:hypothetical protein